MQTDSYTSSEQEIPPNDEMLFHWTLSLEDMRFVTKLSSSLGFRVWIGLQMCCLRRNGTFARSDKEFPAPSISWMNRQFKIHPLSPVESPKRNATWSLHRQSLLIHLGWIDFDPEIQFLKDYIKSLVLKGKAKSEIVADVPAFLQASRIVSPQSKVELERCIRSEIEEASDGLNDSVARSLTEEVRNRLIEILNDEYQPYPKILSDLKKTAPAPSRENFRFLVKMESAARGLAIDCSSIKEVFSEKLIEDYANSVRSVWSINDLKRFATNKQLALLASYLLILYGELLDNIVLMFDRLASKMHAKVQTKWQEQTLKKFTQNRVHRELIVQAAEAFAQSIDCVLKSHSQFDIDALKRALLDNSARGDKDEIDKSKLMVSKIHHFRSILNLFLQTAPQVGAGHEALKTAMDFAKTATKKWVPQEIPHFIEKKYLSIAIEPEGIRRDIWEWFLVMHMVSRLRAHDIYFPHSVKHKGFWERLNSQEVPDENRDPKSDVARVLQEFKSEFELFKDSLKDNKFVKIVDNRIQLSRDLGLGDPVSTKLHDQVQQSLPKIRIEDLIAEIDRETRFSQAFKHHSTHEPLDESRKHILYASLIAHATNIGVSGMATASEGISVDMLEDICKGYQSAHCVREAIRIVNNYQATLEAGNVWGDGSMSSSDGQMFRVHGKSLHVEYHPRRFGVRRGINVVTHQSDREVVLATIVLDGLLGNNSVISPKIHTTDTHGYSDHLFALCWLLDIVFAPRLKDAGDSRLWLPNLFEAGDLTPIFEERRISLSNLSDHWEPVQRIVSALKRGLIDGQTVTMRLANASGDPVANALLDLGRLAKTTFLLRWMRDKEFRQSLHAQLNKGESRHFLARSVNFASGTGYRSADPLDLMHRTSILSLMCNIIVTWNTIAIGNLINSMKSSAAIENDLDISSISPLICGHIARTGTYRFKQEFAQ